MLTLLSNSRCMPPYHQGFVWSAIAFALYRFCLLLSVTFAALYLLQRSKVRLLTTSYGLRLLLSMTFAALYLLQCSKVHLLTTSYGLHLLLSMTFTALYLPQRSKVCLLTTSYGLRLLLSVTFAALYLLQCSKVHLLTTSYSHRLLLMPSTLFVYAIHCSCLCHLPLISSHLSTFVTLYLLQHPQVRLSSPPICDIHGSLSPSASQGLPVISSCPPHLWLFISSFQGAPQHFMQSPTIAYAFHCSCLCPMPFTSPPVHHIRGSISFSILRSASNFPLSVTFTALYLLLHPRCASHLLPSVMFAALYLLSQGMPHHFERLPPPAPQARPLSLCSLSIVCASSTPHSNAIDIVLFLIREDHSHHQEL